MNDEHTETIRVSISLEKLKGEGRRILAAMLDVDPGQLRTLSWDEKTFVRCLERGNNEGLEWLLRRQNILPVFQLRNRTLELRDGIHLFFLRITKCHLVLKGEFLMENCILKDCYIESKGTSFEVIEFASCSFEETLLRGKGVLRMEQCAVAGLRVERWEGGLQTTRCQLDKADWGELDLLGENDFVLHSTMRGFYCVLWRQGGEGSIRGCDLTRARVSRVEGVLRFTEGCVLHLTQIAKIRPNMLSGFPALQPPPLRQPASSAAESE